MDLDSSGKACEHLQATPLECKFIVERWAQQLRSLHNTIDLFYGYVKSETAEYTTSNPIARCEVQVRDRACMPTLPAIMRKQGESVISEGEVDEF